MRHARLHDLLHAGDEEQAILRRNEIVFVLLGDTADAARIAPRRDGRRALPSPEKQVAGCRAAIIERAVGMMRQHTVFRLGSQSFLYESFELAQWKGVGQPAVG